MADYGSMKKEELLEEARNREGLSGYSDKNKDELAAMLEEHDAGSGEETADGSAPEYEGEASDLDNAGVREGLSPSGNEAADKLSDENKDLANAALDASGPLHLQAPEERVMTGAVNEDQAKEQEELLADRVGEEGHAGNFDEAGNPLSNGGTDDQAVARAGGDVKDNLGEDDDREVYEVRPEHVIDFPPPVGQREGSTSRGQDRASDRQEERNPDMAYAEPGGSPLGNAVIGAGSRTGDVYSQKSVLYTDGLSGPADHNLERAYEIPEVLQSSNQEEREAGDESVSEAAKEEKSQNENDEQKSEE